MRSALLNGDGVSLVRVDYGPVHMSMASSTMPASLTDRREHLDQMARFADICARLPEGWHVFVTEESPMGPVLRRRMYNVAQWGPEPRAPFPVELDVRDLTDEHIATVAEPRLFSRRPDRYEVAVHVPGPVRDAPEGDELAGQLAAAFADELLRSLQACTSALPPRTPDP